MVKILVPEPEYFSREAVKILEGAGEVVARKMDRGSLLKEIADADGLVIRVGTKVDTALLENGKKLKVIGSATAGLDHIDLELAKKKGIKIINLEGGNTTPTAEHALALILSLVRKVPWAFDHVKKGLWERHKFFGTELEGKILGVVGFGKIGSKVGGYGKALGMEVLAYDPYIEPEVLKVLGAEPVGLDALLGKSDVITIHSLLTKETENLVGRKEIGKIKQGAVIINVARGRIVDEEALLEGLENGRIGGAALDVYSAEPLGNGSRLVEYAKSHNNLLLTPHIAASTKESVDKAAMYIAQKVKETLTRQL